MSILLTATLLAHLIVSVVSGMLLFIIPGRFLTTLGWAPIDPILSRVLGAALLAMAWGDFRLWRGDTKGGTRLWAEVHLAFSALAGIGVLRHLVVARFPLMVWLLFAGFAVFAVLWLAVLLRHRE